MHQQAAPPAAAALSSVLRGSFAPAGGATGRRASLGGLDARDPWARGSAGILQWREHPGACSGLALDSDAGKDPHKCAINCCQDSKCVLWQMEPQDAACWRGNPSSCMASPLKPASGVRPGAKLPPNDKPGPSQSNLHATVYNSTGIEVVILSNTADTGSTNQPKDQRDAATVEWHGKTYRILGDSSCYCEVGS